MRAVVIFNPTAGRDRGNAIATEVCRELTRHGVEVDMQGTQRPHDASRLATVAAGSADVIVAVGGDGTINEVANGMAAWVDLGRPEGGRTLPALGIVPAGTVNVLARDFGIPSQAARACKVIAAGKRRTLDLGIVNDRHFVLMMGAGIDALTIRNLEPKAKKRFRELAFVSTGLKAGLAAPPPEFLVRVNEEEHRATFCVAGNTRYYAGKLGITPRADPTDGLLDLMVFTGTKRSSLAVFWLELPTNLHLQNQKVLYLCAEKADLVPLDDQHPVYFQTDGELAGRLPARLEIKRRALDVLVP